MWQAGYESLGLVDWLLASDSKWVKQDGFVGIDFDAPGLDQSNMPGDVYVLQSPRPPLRLALRILALALPYVAVAQTPLHLHVRSATANAAAPTGVHTLTKRCC